MRNYVQKTESIDNLDDMSNSNEVEDLAYSSRQTLNKVVATLTPYLFGGAGFTLNKVRDKVNEIMHPNQIHNYQVKSFLILKLGEGIKICPSTLKNESLMFLSANLSADDIAQKVQSIDVIKDTAHLLCKKLKVLYFWSRKKVLYAFDLQDTWTNGKIKENSETLLASLFNRTAINVDDLNKKENYKDDMILDFDDDSDNTDDKETKTLSFRTVTKIICTYSIYQMMVNTVTYGKTKNPLHLMSQSQHYYIINQNRYFH